MGHITFDTFHKIKHNICLGDNAAQSLVVVNRLGKLRLKNNGAPTSKLSFNPRSITTCSRSMSDSCNRQQHRLYSLFRSEWEFIPFINKYIVQNPWGSCVDTGDILFDAKFETCSVKKKYNVKKLFHPVNRHDEQICMSYSISVLGGLIGMKLYIKSFIYVSFLFEMV